jgi:hypothetical protein
MVKRIKEIYQKQIQKYKNIKETKTKQTNKNK